tara:strand:+ start:11010 stop:11885 length:876 start_codon:yes stop_codon:yes gene_type:complete
MPPAFADENPDGLTWLHSFITLSSNFMNFYAPTLIALLAVSQTQAAFTPLGTSADDAFNYGTFSGSVLSSVTLNGTTYTTDQLTQVELVSFEGAAISVLLQQNGGNSNPSSQERRDLIETDWRGDTGIINSSFVDDSSSATFNTPVVNVEGVDMILYEISSNPISADGFQIRINGVQLTVASGDYGDSGADTSNDDVLSLTSKPENLTELLNLNASVSTSNITQSIVGVGIDFSDFGVNEGDTVTSFSYNSNGSSSFDPVIIAAIPEPRTSALLAGLACLSLATLRRNSKS